MSVLFSLQRLRESGRQPKGALIWLGFGFSLLKHNSLNIDPFDLPTVTECRAVSGLDVVMCIKGYTVKYRALRHLCCSLLEARPNRLQVIDFDYKKIAFLKIGERL